MSDFIIKEAFAKDTNLKNLNMKAICHTIYQLSEAGKASGEYCFATNSKIAEYCFVGESSVSHTISVLKELGYVTEIPPKKGKRCLVFQTEKFPSLNTNRSEESIPDTDNGKDEPSKNCKVNSQDLAKFASTNNEPSKNCKDTSQNLQVDLAKFASNYNNYINKDYYKGNFNLFNLIKEKFTNKPSDSFIKKHERLISNLMEHFYIVVNEDTTVPQEEKESVKDALQEKFAECMMIFFEGFEKRYIEHDMEPIHTIARSVEPINNAVTAIYRIIKKPDSYICKQFDLAVDIYFQTAWETKDGRPCDYMIWFFTSNRVLTSIRQTLDKFNNDKKDVIDRPKATTTQKYGGTLKHQQTMYAIDAKIASLELEGYENDYNELDFMNIPFNS